MICPRCRTNNADGARFCRGCGFNFSQQTQQFQNGTAPNGGYAGQNQRYNGPNGGYAGPNGGYNGPNGGYAGPNGGYNGPNRGYAGPNQRYNGPNQGYAGPNRNYAGGRNNKAVKNAGKKAAKGGGFFSKVLMFGIIGAVGYAAITIFGNEGFDGGGYDGGYDDGYYGGQGYDGGSDTLPSVIPMGDTESDSNGSGGDVESWNTGDSGGSDVATEGFSEYSDYNINDSDYICQLDIHHEMTVAFDEFNYTEGGRVVVDVNKDTVVMDFDEMSSERDGVSRYRSSFSLSGKVLRKEGSYDGIDLYYGECDNVYMYTWESHSENTNESSALHSNGLTAHFYLRSYSDGHCELFVNIHGDITGDNEKNETLQRIAVADGGEYRMSDDFSPFSEVAEFDM